MALEHDLFQAFLQNVRVNFGRGNVRVPQKLLDCSQIRPPIEKVAGEGVAQDMRRNALGIKASGFSQRLQFEAQMLPRQMSLGTSGRK